MKKKYKWCHAICPQCGTRVQDVRTEVGTPEPWVSIYPCERCAHPELYIDPFEQAHLEIMGMAARGEILDAQGEPVPAIALLQKEDGEWEIHRYIWQDGQLAEVTV